MTALIAGITQEEAGRGFGPEMIDLAAARRWWIDRLHPSNVWCPACSHGDFSEEQVRKWWNDDFIRCAACGKEFSNRTDTLLSDAKEIDWRRAYLILFLGGFGLRQSEIARRIGVHPSTVSRFLARLEAARG